jgi:serine/threonine protein kinase
MDTSLDRFYQKAVDLNIPMSELFISKLAFAVVSGLAYMKSLGLMHRDVKVILRHIT